MAKFAAINSIVRTPTPSKAKEAKTARCERAAARRAAYVAALVSGKIEVVRQTKAGKVRKAVAASPAQHLELLAKALNAGATLSEIWNAQADAYADDSSYLFLASRYLWAAATDKIMPEFKAAHRAAVADLLGLTAESGMLVEPAVETAPVTEPTESTEPTELPFESQEVAYQDSKGRWYRKVVKTAAEFDRVVERAQARGYRVEVRAA